MDLVLEEASKLHLVESKSARTFTDDFFSGLRRLAESERQRKRAATVDSILVYGGDEPQRRGDARVVPWSRLDRERWG